MISTSFVTLLISLVVILLVFIIFNFVHQRVYGKGLLTGIVRVGAKNQKLVTLGGKEVEVYNDDVKAFFDWVWHDIRRFVRRNVVMIITAIIMGVVGYNVLSQIYKQLQIMNVTSTGTGLPANVLIFGSLIVMIGGALMLVRSLRV